MVIAKCVNRPLYIPIIIMHLFGRSKWAWVFVCRKTFSKNTPFFSLMNLTTQTNNMNEIGYYGFMLFDDDRFEVNYSLIVIFHTFGCLLNCCFIYVILSAISSPSFIFLFGFLLTFSDHHTNWINKRITIIVFIFYTEPNKCGIKKELL